MAYNRLAAWAGIFLCLVIAQLSLPPAPAEEGGLSQSQKNLLHNAAVPIYLSENPSAAIRQLESLIQETDIRQIRTYTSDQKLVAQIVNASVPIALDKTRIENLSIIFQGTMAGSVQLDIGYATPASTALYDNLKILFKSALITALAWFLSTTYLWLHKKLLPKLNTKTKQPGLLDVEDRQPQPVSSSSLLLYVYALPEKGLADKPGVHREALSSFTKKLDNHLRVYGGRILSLSSDCIICRMPQGQSQTDFQQALTFCWGIARPMVYQSPQGAVQLTIKTLLHKTSVAARAGDTYRAISEVTPDMVQALITSDHHAHISHDALSAFEPTTSSTNFSQIQSNINPAVHQIVSVKKSVDTLWQKQEALVAANTHI